MTAPPRPKPKAGTTAGSKGKPSGARRRLDPDELAALEEERDFLLASLEDLDREHDAGDLDDDDHAALRDDYTARAAEVLRAIDERREAFASSASSPPPGRRWAVGVAVVAVALLAGVLVAQASGRRGADQTVTGDIRRTPTQEAQACLPLTFATREDPRKVLEARECYDAVLDDDPRNPTALTYLGWALLLTGDQRLVEPGRDFLLRSVEAAPEYPDAYAFLAILESRLGNYPQADTWLDTFESLDPSPDMLTLTEGLRTEIDQALAGAPPPADPGATTTSTAPPTPQPPR